MKYYHVGAAPGGLFLPDRISPLRPSALGALMLWLIIDGPAFKALPPGQQLLFAAHESAALYGLARKWSLDEKMKKKTRLARFPALRPSPRRSRSRVRHPQGKGQPPMNTAGGRPRPDLSPPSLGRKTAIRVAMPPHQDPEAQDQNPRCGR